jgi:glutathione synthase/RimK-type ligase-like ATP-grasp enzyme
MDDAFLPSLFQEYISKKIEIRSFYLNDVFYSMAIFSQLDSLTTLDYRNYNLEKPNRTVPFCLPESVQIQVKKLMKRLELDTGSIDLILTMEGDYVFLEINPTGQFGWLSKSCNYYIEREIAKHMLS